MKIKKNIAAAVLAVAMVAAVSVPAFAAEGVDSVRTQGTNATTVDESSVVVEKTEPPKGPLTELTITASAVLDSGANANHRGTAEDNQHIRDKMNESRGVLKANQSKLTDEVQGVIQELDGDQLRVIDMFDVSYWEGDHIVVEITDLDKVTFNLHIKGVADDKMAIFHYKNGAWELVATNTDWNPAGNSTYADGIWTVPVMVDSLSPFAVMSTSGTAISLDAPTQPGQGGGNGGVVNSPKTGEGMGMAGIGALVCLMAAAYCVKRAKKN